MELKMLEILDPQVDENGDQTGIIAWPDGVMTSYRSWQDVDGNTHILLDDQAAESWTKPLPNQGEM